MRPLDHRSLWAEGHAYPLSLAAEILDSVPQMLWANVGGADGVEFYNRRWLEFTGLELHPDGSTRRGLIHPDDRARAVAAWERAKATGEPYEATYRLRHRSGEYRWLLSRGRAERDEAGNIIGWYGSCTDVHEHAADRAALAQSESVNRSILSATADSIKMVDVNGVIRFLNDAAAVELSGRGVEQPLGKRWLDTFPGGARLEAGAAFRSASEGSEARFTSFRLNAEGAPEWREFVLAPVTTDGRITGVVVSSRDVTEERLARERLRWAANHDPMTQLPNRSHFQECLEEAIRQARLSEGGVGLLLLDLENLRQVNDALGHGAGDAVLKEVAERLRATVSPRDLAGRLAGDEFGIVVANLADERELESLADAVRDTLRAPFEFDGRLIDCRVRIGATHYPRLGGHAAELLKQAHLALYAAKRVGRPDCAFFEPKMRAEMQNKASMLSLSRDALDNDRVEVFYQPKIKLETHALVGFEALFRWRDGHGRVHLPGTVAAAFEDRELAPAITRRVIDIALRSIRAWLDAGLEVGAVAINAAAPDFRDARFADRLLEQMERAGIPPIHVQLEVTESVFIGRGAECVESTLRQLSQAGVQIALDDFGTGFASLTHLKRFPVDVLKIDQSFVRDLGKRGGDEAIVEGIINLSRSLGLTTVAEGVERQDQELFLTACGCDHAQGFRYGKAMDAAAVAELLGGPRAPMAGRRAEG